jgi:hypothetical protein
MDVEQLLKALDNDENEHLINMTSEKLNGMKKEILTEIQLSPQEVAEYMQKLKEYKYIDEMNHIRHGSFIRWIPISDPENIHLTSGGIICDIKIADTGVHLICKNFARKHYQIKMDECLVFQKLSGQEQVLLAALDHLANK